MDVTIAMITKRYLDCCRLDDGKTSGFLTIREYESMKQKEYERIVYVENKEKNMR